MSIASPSEGHGGACAKVRNKLNHKRHFSRLLKQCFLIRAKRRRRHRNGGFCLSPLLRCKKGSSTAEKAKVTSLTPLCHFPLFHRLRSLCFWKSPLLFHPGEAKLQGINFVMPPWSHVQFPSFLPPRFIARFEEKRGREPEKRQWWCNSMKATSKGKMVVRPTK